MTPSYLRLAIQEGAQEVGTAAAAAMLDRDQLETFATVAEERSAERAAALLNVTRGAVWQRVCALEASLARILLVRGRPLSLTQSGEVLLRHVKTLRMLEGSALCELGPAPRGHAPMPLPIAINADSFSVWFKEVMLALARERRVTLELLIDDQDHTAARLAQGEAMGCISTETKAAPGFTAEPLGSMKYRCYATPAFVAEFFAQGLTLSAALSAPAVLFNRKDSLHDEFLKQRFGVPVERYSKHYLPSPTALLHAIGIGMGYGVVPSSQVSARVRAGELTDLAPDLPMHIDLYWHHWENEPPLMRTIADSIIAIGRRHLAYGGRSTRKPSCPTRSFADFQHG